MKCHYEVLSVDRDANDDGIKKAYRKLALKWHPDKNLDREEESIEQFRVIQQAYEVLIDPQERAWYDKHREAILRGGLGKGGDYEDECLDVYQYYNAACYSGYGDDDKGFYTVYRTVFEELAKEDYEFMDVRESDWEMPQFGSSDSSYDEVVGPFYAFWGSYCTAKSYVWEEKFDTREGPNRQYRRLMEKENKMLRDKAKKERNEEVRALVTFVRKRDKRVQAQKKKLEERAVEIAKLTEERKEKEKQERLEKMANYKDEGWSAMTELEKDMQQLEANLSQQFGDEQLTNSDEAGDSEDELYYEDLFCIACNRTFKTDKSFLNHEKSKKHRENVAAIRAEMEDDDEALDEENPGEVLPSDEDEPLADEKLLQQEIPKQKLSKKQKKKKRQQQKLERVNDGDEDAVSEEENHSNAAAAESITQDAGQEDNSRINGESRHLSGNSASAKIDACAENVIGVDSLPSTSGDVVDAPRDSEPTKKVKTKQQKDGCHSSQHKDSSQAAPHPQACNNCGEMFRSKNKLFAHIKATGHALHVGPVTAAQVDPGLKKGKKKKGKR